MILWGYWRSSAAYRVRIALNLKGLAAEHRFRHLRRGEQRAAEFLALNPQGLVPALVLEDGTVLTQSLAICEYLDETHPDAAAAAARAGRPRPGPRLRPGDRRRDPCGAEPEGAEPGEGARPRPGHGQCLGA